MKYTLNVYTRRTKLEENLLKKMRLCLSEIGTVGSWTNELQRQCRNLKK